MSDDYPCEGCRGSGLIVGWVYAEVGPGCWSHAPCGECNPGAAERLPDTQEPGDG